MEWPLEERRKLLSERLAFVCGCERCVVEEAAAKQGIELVGRDAWQGMTAASVAAPVCQGVGPKNGAHVEAKAAEAPANPPANPPAEEIEEEAEEIAPDFEPKETRAAPAESGGASGGSAADAVSSDAVPGYSQQQSLRLAVGAIVAAVAVAAVVRMARR